MGAGASTAVSSIAEASKDDLAAVYASLPEEDKAKLKEALVGAQAAKSSLTDRKTICICGAGNAAHVFIPFFSEAGYDVTVFADYGDEAARLKAACDENGGITVHDRCDPANIREYKHSPTVVSNKAADAVPQADYIIIALPSFAIKNVFNGVKAHLKDGAILYVMPGQGGPDLLAKQLLGDELTSGKCTFAGVMPMPLNCRIEEFGKKVQLAALKTEYHVATVPAKNSAMAAEALSLMLGGRPVIPVGSYTAIALMGANANLHPARLYGLWGPDSQMGLYEEGKVYSENPLFYETWDEKSADWCQKISNERLAIWTAICEKSPGIGKPEDVPHIHKYISTLYAGQIADDSTLAGCFNSNDGYKGFRCPMKAEGDGFVPDFTSRYFTEDFPETVAMYKGIADLAGVETPVLDEITTFFQKFMGKEYIKDGKWAGADAAQSKCPAAFGVTSLEQLLAD